jgi:hypothetical protein
MRRDLKVAVHECKYFYDKPERPPIQPDFWRRKHDLSVTDLEKAGMRRLIRVHSGNCKAEAAGMGSVDEEVEMIHTKIRTEHLMRTKRELAMEGSTLARMLKMRFDGGERGTLITNLTGWRGGYKTAGSETIDDREEMSRLEKQDEIRERDEKSERLCGTEHAGASVGT